MTKKHSERFLKLVEDARRRVREVSIADVKHKLDNGDQFHLVDVREDGEWAQAHLPGATHLGKGIIERDIEAAIPNTASEIVLYCGGGFRSALAAGQPPEDGVHQRALHGRGLQRLEGGGLPGGIRDLTRLSPARTFQPMRCSDR